MTENERMKKRSLPEEIGTWVLGRLAGEIVILVKERQKFLA